MEDSGHGSRPQQASTKRTNNACIKCRERKVKCSGTRPCITCRQRGHECEFGTDDRKVVVSQRFLNELKRRSGLFTNGDGVSSPNRRRRATNNSLQNRNRGSLSDVDRPGDPSPAASTREQDKTLESSGDVDKSDDLSLSNMRNPLATGRSQVLLDIHGRRRFLGPSSTWAYSRQVMTMIKHHLTLHETPEMPLNADGRAFDLEWPSRGGKVGPLTAEDIPSLDYALYLTNTVKFHLGQMYHLFDEKCFMDGLYKFYNSGLPSEPSVDTRLWYVHYLLIMAFGKALLASGTPHQMPMGGSFVSRALEILPDVNGLYIDPTLSIEILCCLALYLQSIDHRNSAYTYIGQAFRIALTQGLHRNLVGESLSPAEVHRLRCVWWTLYILDRKFSSLMGAPNSIQDDDITAPLPETGHDAQTANVLNAHVALSRLQAKVLNTVYGVDGNLDQSFLKNIQQVLRDMATLSSELNGVFEFKFDHSEPISRVSATLNLYYHQCIVLATRPLLMCLVRELLARQNQSPARDTRGITDAVKALLRTSYESAAKSLQILSALQAQQLLETFLPFDLESTFSSAFVLALLSALQPLINDWDVPHTFVEVTFSLLDTMISRGNHVAGFRKEELERLLEILRLMRIEPAPVLTTENHSSLDIDFDQAVGGFHGVGVNNTVNGLSPDQMLSIAELLDWEPGFDQLGDAQLTDGWLWAEAESSIQAEDGPEMS